MRRPRAESRGPGSSDVASRQRRELPSERHETGLAMSNRIDGQRLMKAVPDLVQELGSIHDALAAGAAVTIQPGSAQASRIRTVMQSIEAPSPWAAQIA